MLGDLVMTGAKRRIRAVIFDWAGTTIDHGSRAPVEVFVEVFRRAGIEVSAAEARGPMGRAKREHIAELLALPRIESAWGSRHGRVPTEEDVDRLYEEFLPLQGQVLARHCDVIAGVPEVVAGLRSRGIKVGTTTGYTRALMDVVAPLARAGGFDPEVIVCADDVPRGRPAPWMVFRAAERLGVYPISDVVIVDDTTVGIEAGRNAGTLSVAVTRTGNSLGMSLAEVARCHADALADRLRTADAEFRLAGADAVIESVADLIPWLDELDVIG
jgi:phosphonoacetaldehyde hydrolase